MSVVDVKMIERFCMIRFVFVVEWGRTKRVASLDALSEAHIIRERPLGRCYQGRSFLPSLRTIESYKGDKFKRLLSRVSPTLQL